MVYQDGLDCSYELRMLDCDNSYKDGKQFPQGDLMLAEAGPNNPRYRPKHKPKADRQ
jgi:hypothetical protein